MGVKLLEIPMFTLLLTLILSISLLAPYLLVLLVIMAIMHELTVRKAGCGEM